MKWLSRAPVLVVTAAMAATTCSWDQPVSSHQPAPPAATASSAPTSSQAQSPGGQPGDRLPDLTMLPVEAFHVAFEGRKKVLRFSADLMNAGDGPLDITGIRANTGENDLRVTQKILQTDGRQRAIKTTSVMRYSELDGHNHFHVKDFERYRMRPVGASDWRISRKEGFCLRDDGNLQGHASRYPDATYDCGADLKDEALQVHQGLSEGWVDVYDWYLEGQFIELEGFQLPGDFCLEAEADPDRLLTEARRDNNMTSTLLHITETEATVTHQGC
jgi:hypothetical protein